MIMKAAIIEVGPRDGLQNEKQQLDAQIKVDLINRLAEAGLITIEAGAFVSPKAVPQMIGSAEILEQVDRLYVLQSYLLNLSATL